ncbi:MAG: hypothetical protein ACLFQK_12050 [Fibrobacterota bacterium]
MKKEKKIYEKPDIESEDYSLEIHAQTCPGTPDDEQFPVPPCKIFPGQGTS